VISGSHIRTPTCIQASQLVPATGARVHGVVNQPGPRALTIGGHCHGFLRSSLKSRYDQTALPPGPKARQFWNTSHNYDSRGSGPSRWTRLCPDLEQPHAETLFGFCGNDLLRGSRFLLRHRFIRTTQELIASGNTWEIKELGNERMFKIRRRGAGPDNLTHDGNGKGSTVFQNQPNGCHPFALEAKVLGRRVIRILRALAPQVVWERGPGRNRGLKRRNGRLGGSTGKVVLLRESGECHTSWDALSCPTRMVIATTMSSTKRENRFPHGTKTVASRRGFFRRCRNHVLIILGISRSFGADNAVLHQIQHRQGPGIASPASFFWIVETMGPRPPPGLERNGQDLSLSSQRVSGVGVAITGCWATVVMIASMLGLMLRLSG